MHRSRRRIHLNWRSMLVRILVTALALVVVTFLVPRVQFVDKTVVAIVITALALGLINAIVKPILEFATLSFIFVTYGLIVVILNAISLYLLQWLLPEFYSVHSIFWALVAGALLGIMTSFLESLFGLDRPILETDDPLRKAVAQGTSQPIVQQLVYQAESDLSGESSHAAEATPKPEA